jgi:hypothetical protein
MGRQQSPHAPKGYQEALARRTGGGEILTGGNKCKLSHLAVDWAPPPDLNDFGLQIEIGIDGAQIETFSVIWERKIYSRYRNPQKGPFPSIFRLLFSISEIVSWSRS